MNYIEKLRDPRWQKKRLEILNRDSFTCQSCRSTENTLNVHHRWYDKGEPWEIADDALVTLCEDCHAFETHQRASMEQELLSQLRKCGLSTVDLYTLAGAFNQIPAGYNATRLFTRILTWIATNENVFFELRDRFVAMRKEHGENIE